MSWLHYITCDDADYIPYTQYAFETRSSIRAQMPLKIHSTYMYVPIGTIRNINGIISYRVAIDIFS